MFLYHNLILYPGIVRDFFIKTKLISLVCSILSYLLVYFLFLRKDSAMSDLSKKKKSNIFICAVALSFNSTVKPSQIAGFQQFYNSIFQNLDFQKIYTGFSSLQFSEESVESSAGTYYKQKFTFRFPITDHERSQDIHLLRKIKFIQIKLTNGLVINIGRNDAFQNARPKVVIKTNERTLEAEISTSSITPAGFTPNADWFGLPTYVPLTF